VAAALLAAPVALAADPVFTSGAALKGDAVVGSTLTVSATWTADPGTTVTYSWRRYSATGGSGTVITGATTATYVVTAADVGFRLGARIQLKTKGLTAVKSDSVTTAIVLAAPAPVPVPTPSPLPTPNPNPTPQPSSDPNPKPDPVPAGATSFTEPVAPIVDVAAKSTLMRPFPIVRIRGYFKPGGVRVTLLSVSAPHSAHVTATCVGKGCPRRTVSVASAPARLRAFERFLPAGTLLALRVTSAGRIGKYASFVIRAHSAPLRKDLCLMPGKTKPAGCPTR
jgi:Ig domain of plant-specific actin-binding protein